MQITKQRYTTQKILEKLVHSQSIFYIFKKSVLVEWTGLLIRIQSNLTFQGNGPTYYNVFLLFT